MEGSGKVRNTPTFKSSVFTAGSHESASKPIRSNPTWLSQVLDKSSPALRASLSTGQLQYANSARQVYNKKSEVFAEPGSEASGLVTRRRIGPDDSDVFLGVRQSETATAALLKARQHVKPQAFNPKFVASTAAERKNRELHGAGHGRTVSLNLEEVVGLHQSQSAKQVVGKSALQRRHDELRSSVLPEPAYTSDHANPVPKKRQLNTYTIDSMSSKAALLRSRSANTSPVNSPETMTNLERKIKMFSSKVLGSSRKKYEGLRSNEGGRSSGIVLNTKFENAQFVRLLRSHDVHVK